MAGRENAVKKYVVRLSAEERDPAPVYVTVDADGEDEEFRVRGIPWAIVNNGGLRGLRGEQIGKPWVPIPTPAVWAAAEPVPGSA